MSLNDELKDKADAAEIKEEDLDKVNGGMILNTVGTPEYDPYRPYAVIHNNTGEVLSRWSTQAQACDAAKQYHSGSSYDTQTCSIEQVEYLRSHPQIV